MKVSIRFWWESKSKLFFSDLYMLVINIGIIKLLFKNSWFDIFKFIPKLFNIFLFLYILFFILFLFYLILCTLLFFFISFYYLFIYLFTININKFLSKYFRTLRYINFLILLKHFIKIFLKLFSTANLRTF
jgi:hypothetical protein